MSIGSDNKLGLARVTIDHDGLQQVRFPPDAIAVSEIPKGSPPPARSAIPASPASVIEGREDARHRRLRRFEPFREQQQIIA